MITISNTTITTPDKRSEVLLQLAHAVQSIAEAVAADNRSIYGVYVNNSKNEED